MAKLSFLGATVLYLLYRRTLFDNVDCTLKSGLSLKVKHEVYVWNITQCYDS